LVLTLSTLPLSQSLCPSHADLLHRGAPQLPPCLRLSAPLMQTSFTLGLLNSHGRIEALCGWFDVQFKGSEQNPTDNPVSLSTAPDPTGRHVGVEG
jgi:hypothetical protein